MQSDTEIDVAITCQVFSHYLPFLQEGFPLSFRFRHIYIRACECQMLRHTHVQGWVVGTVKFWAFLNSLFCLGNWLAVQGTLSTYGHPALWQAEAPALQHLSFSTVFHLPLLKDSPCECIYKPLFTPQPSACKLGGFSRCNTAVKPKGPGQINNMFFLCPHVCCSRC